jgi:hypothetical protein
MEKYQKFIELLKCPLSKKLFMDPVMYKGKVYERCEIIKKNKGVGEKLKTVLSVRSLVSNVIKMFPKLEKDKYSNISSSNEYIMNINYIRNQIHNGKYDELLKYKSYNMKIMDINLFAKILKNAKLSTSLYFINNTVNNSDQWFAIKDDYTPLHYVCATARIEIIEMVIGKLCGLNTYMAMTLEKLIDENESLSDEDRRKIKVILSVKSK